MPAPCPHFLIPPFFCLSSDPLLTSSAYLSWCWDGSSAVQRVILLFRGPQVRPAVAPQSLRGGSLPQLLPRQPVPDLGQLLPEQGLLQPVLHQRVERHAGCGVVPCQLTHPLHRPVSADEAQTSKQYWGVTFLQHKCSALNSFN